ncbi:MAG: sigma-54-dependent Fis family transcriptional regulator [Acidobacteria bacterium]|nr:sigma-54-dependent Fis family transcriptional regulator [Acidobacteriota bacterium]
MASVVRLLLVDSDPVSLDSLQQTLTQSGFDVDAADDGSIALRRAECADYDLLVVADRASDTEDGLAFLERARSAAPALPALALSSCAALDAAVRALRAGALDYLTLPMPEADLAAAIRRALQRARARAAHGEDGAPRAHEDAAGEFEDLIGRNPRMQRVYSLIRTVAPANSTVLISGESGTGKERVAAAIHRRSPRRAKAFIRVNCSAFAEGVLESELFGHEQGAFTGAVRSRAGVFRKADGGTLFLDEVGDLPLSTQVKLLRVIQEREVQPVGGDAALPVDVRLIAATNHDLAAEARNGHFREDLYFRLNVIPIHLPALRERPDDIPHLADHFLHRFAESCGKSVRGFTDRALSLMERYPWPGNVRELENAVERAVVLACDDVIDVQDLPPELRGVSGAVEGAFQVNTVRLSEVEEIVIRRVLSRTGWNIKRSAEILGITRATLYSKIRKFGLAVTR